MKNVLSLIIAFTVIISMSITTFAAPTPFIVDPLTEEEQATIIKNVPVKKIEKIDWNNPIQSFDVNEDEMILLLFNRSNEYAVCIYNSDFEFQYGFSFNAEGTVVCEWSGNDIMVFFVRGDIYARLNTNGQWVDLYRVSQSTENNSLMYSLFDKEEVTVNNVKYKIQNDMGILNWFQVNHNHSQLIKIDENSNETILYDINSLQTTRTILVLVFTIGFVSTALIVLLKPIIQEKKIKKK